MRACQNGIEDFFHRSGNIDHLHLATVHHDFPYTDIFKIENPMQHGTFRMVVTNHHVIGMQFNRATQFAFAIKSGSLAAAKQAQGGLHQDLNGLGDRRKQNDQHAHWARHTQRHGIGMLKRIGFWQNFREYQNKGGHHGGGIDHTVLAKQFDHHRRCKRRGQNIDHVVAKQNRAQQTFLILAQSVDDPGARVTILFLVMHDRTRRSRQRGFRAREECRKHQQQKNHDNRDRHSGPSPNGDCNRASLFCVHL